MKMMHLEPILAYHIVPEEAFEDVVADGALIPAVDRVVPQTFKSECMFQIESTSSFGKRRVVEKTVKAMKALVMDEIERLEDWQEKQGMSERFEGRKAPTRFECWDFLAGDLGSIFLSDHDWAWVPDQGPTGFVFDAEDLIRKGARLRKRDFMGRYEMAMRIVLKKKFKDRKSAQAGILKALDDVQKDELRGEEALEYLVSATSYEEMEIVWAGEIPLAWALEAWKEGGPVEISEVVA